MKKQSRLLLGAVIMGLLISLPTFKAPSPVSAQSKTQVRFVTLSPGSGSYQSAAAIVAVINRHSNKLRLTLTPTGGFVQAMNLVQRGEAEIGQIQTWAFEGMKTGKGEVWTGLPPFPEARAMFLIDKNIMHFVVRKDSGIKSVRDLKGKRIAQDSPAYSSHYTNKTFLNALGYDYSKDLDIKEGSINERHTWFKEGKIDGFLQNSFPGAAVFKDLTSEMSVLFLETPQTAIDKMNQVYGPGSILPDTIKAGLYKDLNADVKSWSVVVGPVTAVRVPEDVVYEMVKLFFENQQEAATLYARAAEATPELATQKVTIEHHPGALKYFKEKGWIK